MPNPEDTVPSVYANRFKDWLEEVSIEQERIGPDVVDLALLAMNCFALMRGVLTREEVHATIHRSLHYVEEHLENNEEAVLAETWRGMEGGFEMFAHLQEIASPQNEGLPDDFRLRD